jgi:hypothetical protein
MQKLSVSPKSEVSVKSEAYTLSDTYAVSHRVYASLFATIRFTIVFLRERDSE